MLTPATTLCPFYRRCRASRRSGYSRARANADQVRSHNQSGHRQGYRAEHSRVVLAACWRGDRV